MSDQFFAAERIGKEYAFLKGYSCLSKMIFMIKIVKHMHDASSDLPRRRQVEGHGEVYNFLVGSHLSLVNHFATGRVGFGPLILLIL